MNDQHSVTLALGNFSVMEMCLAATVALLLFVIWLLTRHQECHYHDEPEGTIDELLQAVAGLTHGRVSTGNAVELIQGPDFFKRLCDDLRSATHSIHFETFLWEEGKASDLLTEALCEAAGRGVKVRIMTDARGSSGMGKMVCSRLENAGCDLHSFHRWRIMNLGRFNIRDHRKIAVIDGKIAYVGGHCITDRWLEDQEKFPVYRDITARLRGPVVGSIQSVFGENWIESECGLFVDKDCFPELEPCGEARAHVASIRPDGCPSSVQVLHYLAIALAKKRILIQNPYFLPDPNGVKALAKAAQRGVDVRIMTPAVKATDSFFVTYAGHSHYTSLLEAGVRIFEYQPTLLHQKIICVDDEWCGIGSSNFDDRSFEINDEITVGVHDRKIVAELNEIFARDLKSCREINLEEWKKRPLLTKIRERVFYLFNEQF